MRINILNLYYLLSYSWNHLPEAGIARVSGADYDSLKQLFAKVLSNGTKHLIKLGIDRSYITVSDEVAGLKGKFNIGASVSKNLLVSGRTVSEYDELDYNVLHNQILKSTIYFLLQDRELDKETHKELKSSYLNFHNVELIVIQKDQFRKVQLHRNIRHYDFLLRVCKFIFDNSALMEKGGDYIFREFTKDDRKMAGLFESFVRNFYKRHAQGFRVKRETIDWALQTENESSKSLLPKMNTDLTLESESQKIIFDAKYYSKTLAVNYEKDMIHSAHLYQIFSYLLNQEEKGTSPKHRRCTGVLLYPLVDKPMAELFKYKEHHILIRTIDLNQ